MTDAPLRLLLLFLTPLALSAPARAQPGPTLEAAATMPDGREARAFTFGDGLGYRLDVDGAVFPGNAEGRPYEAVVGDVDGDGASDLILRIDEGAAWRPRTAHVWDVTLENARLMHVSTQMTDAEDPLVQLRREVQGRFAFSNGRAAVGYLRNALDLLEDADWEAPALAFPNHLNTLEGVLVHAEVREARAAVAAAEDAEAADAAHRALEAAMERRALYARELSGTIYD